jgi:hypothetical protein
MRCIKSTAAWLYGVKIGVNNLRPEVVGYGYGKHPFNQSKGQTMKQTRLLKILAAGAATAVALSVACAQESTTTTTTSDGGVVSSTTRTTALSGTGTISTIDPTADYIMFRGETGAAPVRYYYSKKTTIVDPEGRTVEWSALRPDMPVNYTYVKEGDRMVITRVTLAKPISYYKETTTTTTTTTRP